MQGGDQASYTLWKYYCGKKLSELRYLYSRDKMCILKSNISNFFFLIRFPWRHISSQWIFLPLKFLYFWLIDLHCGVYDVRFISMECIFLQGFLYIFNWINRVWCFFFLITNRSSGVFLHSLICFIFTSRHVRYFNNLWYNYYILVFVTMYKNEYMVHKKHVLQWCELVDLKTWL